MLPPEDIIGQKVWLEIPRDPDYPSLDPIKVQAILSQPTSPPWFYARFDNPPPSIRENGKWLSLLEAQQAYLYAPVLDDLEFEDDFQESFDYEDEYRVR